MSSDDSNELFDKYIEIDEDSADGNSENTPAMKQPKTKKVQYDRIAEFFNEHDEQCLDKDTYKQLWDDLAAKLNDMGPPDHTVPEWKRIWSVHKHNAKRKRMINETDTKQQRKMLCSGKPSSSKSLAIPNVVNLSDLSGQVTIIIENQSNMIANQTLIIQELQSSNELLQQLVKIAKK